jgi:CubicO group peptidase (beta-lactamase class C family)
MTIRSLLHFILTLVLATNLSAATKVERVQRLNDIVDAVLKNHPVPALAGGIVTSDGLIAVGYSGIRSKNAKSKVELNDKWLLNSCTKSITATMIAALVEDEKLSWDTTIKQIFGADAVHPELQDVTLHELLGHRSGLKRDFSIGTAQEIQNSGEKIIILRSIFAKQLLSKEPEFERGAFEYSNAGYVIAGHMAEKVTKKSWEYLIKKYVFRPLGMTRSGFGKPPHGKSSYPRNAVGHGDSEPVKGVPIFEDINDPTYGPAGWTHSTMKDWSKFVQEHLKGLNGKKTKILTTELFKKLHTPLPGDGNPYALGWGVWNKSNHEHAGNNHRWCTLMRLNPASDVAFIAATNIGREVGGMDAVHDLVKALETHYFEKMKQ